MSAANEKGKYELVPIEGTVNDRALVLWVPERYFTATTTLVENTTLTNFMSSEAVPKGDAITNGFGAYVYREQLSKVGGSLRFVFLENKTEAQQVETVREPRSISMPIDWPDWLVTLYGVKVKEPIQREENNSGLTPSINDVSSVRNYDRYALIKGGTYNSTVIVSEYFSHTPIESLVATEPRPMPVFYNYFGMQNRFDCLHDEIRTPEIGVELQLIPGFGTKTISERWALGSVFPRTNMVGWAPHDRNVNAVFRDGGIYYTVQHVIPPDYEKRLLI